MERAGVGPSSSDTLWRKEEEKEYNGGGTEAWYNFSNISVQVNLILI